MILSVGHAYISIEQESKHRISHECSKEISRLFSRFQSKVSISRDILLNARIGIMKHFTYRFLFSLKASIAFDREPAFTGKSVDLVDTLPFHSKSRLTSKWPLRFDAKRERDAVMKWLFHHFLAPRRVSLYFKIIGYIGRPIIASADRHRNLHHSRVMHIQYFPWQQTISHLFLISHRKIYRADFKRNASARTINGHTYIYIVIRREGLIEAGYVGLRARSRHATLTKVESDGI